MPLPKMTDEQRAAALEKAKEARAKRAKLKEDIKSGKLTGSLSCMSCDDLIATLWSHSRNPRDKHTILFDTLRHFFKLIFMDLKRVISERVQTR